MTTTVRSLALAVGTAAALVFQGNAATEEIGMSAEATIADIEKTWGFVPGLVKAFPPSALPGSWVELKILESENTVLSAKEKALTAVGVAAQISCQYCVWLDTRSAYLAGATDQEVQEAVAVAAIARHWSAVLHGNQIDIATLKQEFTEFDKAAMEMREKTMARQ
ncbi:carboxymuconolactone decarboxylase family protein [Nitratireductor luteus]|uniref:carboxymuconolactone decarboxylase family protein n=1 Tax=Nitratireductor luteus TaxID=2976980 RepID=UPI002240696A|nr:carboxymuconolactone decarboxylase family protein [Nitratireductor luteus]